MNNNTADNIIKVLKMKMNFETREREKSWCLNFELHFKRCFMNIKLFNFLGHMHLKVENYCFYRITRKHQIYKINILADACHSLEIRKNRT